MIANDKSARRMYVVVGALIGAAAGGAVPDSFLGVFSIAVFAVVGATIGATARRQRSGT